MEDDFRFGLTLQKSCKLFANFDKSDVIVASPLGLKLIVDGDAEIQKENHFLSSIEILVIDRANTICMQNWSHLETVLGSLNLIP
jgi:U3 small nucleolar RNA-associated protein 25